MLGIDQQQVFSVFLDGSYSLLEQRIAARSHEYMAKELLRSQLDTLEKPETGLTVKNSEYAGRDLSDNYRRFSGLT